MTTGFSATCPVDDRLTAGKPVGGAQGWRSARKTGLPPPKVDLLRRFAIRVTTPNLIRGSYLTGRVTIGEPSEKRPASLALSSPDPVVMLGPIPHQVTRGGPADVWPRHNG